MRVRMAERGGRLRKSEREVTVQETGSVGSTEGRLVVKGHTSVQ